MFKQHKEINNQTSNVTFVQYFDINSYKRNEVNNRKQHPNYKQLSITPTGRQKNS